MASIANHERAIVLPPRLAERLTYLAYGLSSDMMTVTRLDDGCLVEANDAFYRVTGYSPEEAVGFSFTDLGLWVRPGTAAELAELLREHPSFSGFECELRARSGEMHVEELSAEAVSVDGQDYVVGTYRDITDQRRAEDLIRYLAYHDQLTGLANRALFEEHLEKALSRARRSHGAVAVLYLDMDNLKLVNDRFGHAAGDQLLVQAGERLSTVARQTDSVARLGGDEFLLLLADLPLGEDGSSIAAVEATEGVAGRIREQFRQPFRLADAEVTATASIGSSIYPFDAMDAGTLLRNADVAMFRNKEARRHAPVGSRHTAG